MARIEDIKWANWKVGLTAYGSVVKHQLGEMMTAAETSIVPLYVAVMGSLREAAYEPAVHTLAGEQTKKPLTELMNSGEGEWMLACSWLETGCCPRPRGGIECRGTVAGLVGL